MNKTINDIVREVVEGEGECVLPEDMTWEDCHIEGHEGCYVMVCPCGTEFPDCDDK